MRVYENKEYAEAMSLFQRICDEYPGLYDEVCSARTMIGHCHRGLGQEEEAIEAYQEALDKINEWSSDNLGKRFLLTTTYLSIGRTYAELGQDAKALEAFETCIQQCDGWKEPEEWPHKEALEAVEQLRKP
jgi:tetratricopeptide (TPR) repeat protein